MTINTFALDYDTETQIAFVKKVQDELTKNRKDTDQEIVTGFMPQLLDNNGYPHKMCPVRSFENYIAHLNPKCKRLWPRPKSREPNSVVWFKNRPVGHGPIDSFMSDLSALCNLSQRYTNHCIRVTGVTTLRRGHFNEKQVMSVTGHRSVQSLAIYQRVRSNEKIRMGMCLTFSLFHPHEALQIKQAQLQQEDDDEDFEPPGPQPLCAPQNAVALPHPIAPKPMPNTPAIKAVPENHALDPEQPQIVSLDAALVPYEAPNNQKNTTPVAPDFDLQAILQEFNNADDDDNDLLLAATQIEKNHCTTKTAMVKKTSSPHQKPREIFQNCTFGNIGSINIHIHKH